MQQGIARQGANGQGHQELNEMLVKDLLHDGNNEYTKDAAKADDNNGTNGGRPQTNFILFLFMVFHVIIVIMMWISCGEGCNPNHQQKNDKATAAAAAEFDHYTVRSQLLPSFN